MTSAYTAHTIERRFSKLLFLIKEMVGARGFEAIAPDHDTSKNNHLAIQQNQKTTSNNLKQPSSAYTLHTMAFMCVLFLSACSKVSQTPPELERASKPLTLIGKSEEGVLISDQHGNLYSYSENYYFAQTIMASDLKAGQILIGVKDEEN